MGPQHHAQERRPAAAHHVALQRGQGPLFPQHLPPVLRHPPGPAGRHGPIPGAGRPVRQKRVLPLWPERLQGAGRLLRHGQVHRQGNGPGRVRDDLRLPDQRGLPQGVRPGHLLHRHRRQPRPRRGVGGQQAGAEGCGTYAQGQLQAPVRQHRQGGRRRHH